MCRASKIECSVAAKRQLAWRALFCVETSFVELYEQQPLFDDIYMLLKSWGFAYQGSFDQLRDPRTGKTVQEDSVFVRS